MDGIKICLFLLLFAAYVDRFAGKFMRMWLSFFLFGKYIDNGHILAEKLRILDAEMYLAGSTDGCYIPANFVSAEKIVVKWAQTVLQRMRDRDE